MNSFAGVGLTHLHLLLNHVPTVGAVVAVALLLVAFARRDEDLRRAGLEILFVIAVLTLPVYVTGVAAYRQLRETPAISDTAMLVHQDAALGGFVAMELAGFVAWLALWQMRRRGRAAPGVVPVVMLLSFVALALMGRAANLGGEIRHPEILAVSPGITEAVADPEAVPSTEGTPTANEGFVAAAIGTVAVTSTWVWPAAEAIHFLGLALSLGILLAVNLRILGVMRQVPFADVHRLLPWGMLGFGTNLITGMFFFVGQPGQYADSAPFYWKVVFLMIAGANFLYLTVFGKAWSGEGWTSGVIDKAMAIGSIAAWLGVLYAGRMLPFLGNAF